MIDDGRRPESVDCPACGVPVLVADSYGGNDGRVVLDALPLNAWRLNPQFRAHASPELGPLYAPHACPVNREESRG